MLVAGIDPRVRVQRLRIFDLAYSDHPTVVRVTMTPEMNCGVRLSKSSYEGTKARMDHVRLPKDPVGPPIEVPFLCAKEHLSYTAGSFLAW